ncbi:MAG: WecB/TagA/CpsF family glycosyltransferase [Candidatus Moranbacteria bacterium]|nr:WecB/TagA/CpsF family glycosyltransferase [Candidatus Moranbacteria bacterium]
MSCRNRNEILGIRIDSRSQDELERIIASTVTSGSFTRIATVNPEFLVLSHGDVCFRDCLLKADIRIADGSGVVLAGLIYDQGVSRYPGADLVRFILSVAEQAGVSVFLATKGGGLSTYEDVRKAVVVSYPGLRVDGADMLPGSDAESERIRYASVVLCNFGAPEQERFLESFRSDPGSIRLVMGVGGTFDFLTGRRPRAPRWMRSAGLEWLFRLAIQPKRLGRIWNAVVIFPFLCLSDRMRGGKQ